MTHHDFIAVLRQKETLNTEYTADLKEMVECYPYFVPARLLFVKKLQESYSIHYGASLKKASVYCSNRRWFYYYLHPDKMLSTEPYLRNKNAKSSGDYFDMISMIESEGGNTRQSLRSLAEKLKSARAIVTAPLAPTPKAVTILDDLVKTSEENISVHINEEDPNLAVIDEISESNAKKLIRERKYKKAIEILRALNLNNTKKSVYFADQIRFLEKVIINSKK
jgi:hypothetical protein